MDIKVFRNHTLDLKYVIQYELIINEYYIINVTALIITFFIYIYNNIYIYIY
jgi:hypothetical protein